MSLCLLVWSVSDIIERCLIFILQFFIDSQIMAVALMEYENVVEANWGAWELKRCRLRMRGLFVQRMGFVILSSRITL